jgi:hypothetical protein
LLQSIQKTIANPGEKDRDGSEETCTENGEGTVILEKPVVTQIFIAFVNLKIHSCIHDCHWSVF